MATVSNIWITVFSVKEVNDSWVAWGSKESPLKKPLWLIFVKVGIFL